MSKTRRKTITFYFAVPVSDEQWTPSTSLASCYR